MAVLMSPLHCRREFVRLREVRPAFLKECGEGFPGFRRTQPQIELFVFSSDRLFNLLAGRKPNEPLACSQRAHGFLRQFLDRFRCRGKQILVGHNLRD